MPTPSWARVQCGARCYEKTSEKSEVVDGGTSPIGTQDYAAAERFDRHCRTIVPLDGPLIHSYRALYYSAALLLSSARERQTVT